MVIPSINCSDFGCIKKRLEIASSFFNGENSNSFNQKSKIVSHKSDGWVHPAPVSIKNWGWVHIDISDGKFTPHISWNNPEELSGIMDQVSGIKIEIHLMVEDPEAQIDSWLRAGAGRLIVHLESMRDPIYILEKCKKYGAECFLAINPATEVERLLVHLDDPRTKSPPQQPGNFSGSVAKDAGNMGVTSGGALVLDSATRGTEAMSDDIMPLYFDGVLILGVFPGPSGQAMKPEVIEKIKFLHDHDPNLIIEIDGGVNLETAKLAKDAGANLFVAGAYIFNASNPVEACRALSRVIA